jgi:cellulose synthase operon protein C
MTRHYRLLWLMVGSALAASVLAAEPTPTIKDVLKRPVDLRVGEKAHADSQRARDNYEAFLALSTQDDALRADAMRRLGDLKLEAGEEERIGRDLTRGAPLATSDAIRLYSALLAAEPNYPHADAVLYQLSRAYEAKGDEAESLQTLETLVNRFPHSALAAEAFFRRGEYFFSARKWADAEGAYQAVLSGYPTSEFVEQSSYKLGWSRFKSGDTDAALDAFVTLLDRRLVTPDGHEADLESFSRPQRELLEDTLRVCSVIFSGEDGTVGIDRLLARRGRRPYEYQLYATLGDLYASKERWTDAAAAYKGFAKLDPWHERAPVLQSVAIDAYRRGGFTQLVLLAKQEYVDQYGLNSPYWSHHSVDGMPLVVREVKQNLQDVAAYYHERAQASKAAADFQDAAKWYREYLSEFPTDAAAPETAYLLSDALFESHQYEASASEYTKVAYDFPKTARSATAAYAAVVAFEKEESASAPGDRKALHEKGIEAGIRFAETFPEHPESAAVLVRAARQRLEDSNYGSAVDLASRALSRQPGLPTDLQRDALLVRANGEFELGHYDRAEQAGTELLASLGNSDPRRQAVEDRVAAAIYRQAEALRESGAQVEAANAFLRIARVVPAASIREAADYDAAAAFLAAEQWSDAISVLERYRKDYPRSERQPEVTRRLASAYLASKNPLTAAHEFERIAAQSAGNPDTEREAMLQAADLYEKAADKAAAVAVLDRYVRRFPEPFDTAIEVRQKLADLAEPTRRLALLEELVRVESTGASRRSDRTRTLAAQASLELAAPLREAFVAVRLSSPLKKSLEAKRTALQRALTAYEKAEKYAVAEVATAATFEMAELYRHLGQDLLTSDRPKNLTPDALEQYGLLLEEQAFPFEEKAIELHELNASRLTSAGVYDESVRGSLSALASLKPARFGKTEVAEDLTIDMLTDDTAAVPLEVTVRYQEALAIAPGDRNRAEAEMTAVAESVPHAAGPIFNLAVLATQAEQFDRAHALLARAIAIAPTSSMVWDQDAIVLRHLGRFAEAEKAYRAALSADHDNVKAHRNFGVLLDIYQGRSSEAAAEWKQAIELQGTDKVLEGWVAEVARRAPAAERPSGGSAQ